MNELYTCKHCGTEHSRDDMVETSIGLVCQDCRDEHFIECEHCGEIVYVDETAEVTVRDRFRWGYTSEYWCDSCVDNDAFRCTHCEKLHSNDMLEMEDSDHEICSQCSDYYFTCYDCGAVLHESDAYWDEEAEEHYCGSCWQDHENDCVIHDYGFKPDPDIRGRRGEDLSTELTFGLELEVDAGYGDTTESKEDTARKVLDAAEGRVYCKRDGSLSRGFEIVTHPGTLAHHMYEMHWANIARLCSKDGWKSHDIGTCGLHIHVGRSQLGRAQGWEVHEAVQDNLVVLVDRLKSALTIFSRRTDEQLRQWADMPYIGTPDDPDELKARIEAYRNSRDRYQTLNFNNGGTIEFRLFRGTLNRDTIIASIQLVSNLCKFAMSHTLEECLAVTYMDIVAVNPYKELVAYSLKRTLPVPAQVA